MDGARISEAEVIRHWLALEGGKTDDVPDRPTTREALDELLARKPGAAAFLWRARPIEWWQVTISRTEFERLRLIGGPENLLWRALAPDGRVMTAAERIHTGDPGTLAAETGVDIGCVCNSADTLNEDTELDALVLTSRRGNPPHVADGNHRAVAVGVHLLRTGEYNGIPAYLGIGANPVLGPLRQRMRALCSRLRPDSPRW